MTLQPIFKARDFSTLLPSQNLSYTVRDMSWHVIGGCQTATITVTGGENELGGLFARLRCPVEIYDDKSRACWWGYISTIRYQVGGVEISASLDKMANSVAVAYSFVAAGTQSVGGRKTTAWSTDTTSQGVYGTKEYLSSASGLTDAVAEAQRDVILALRKYPQASATQTGGNSPATVTIECRGWWETLNWRYIPGGSPVGASYKTIAGSTTQKVGDVFEHAGLFQDFTTPAFPGYVEPLSVSVYAMRTATVPDKNLFVAIEEPGKPLASDRRNSIFYGSLTAASVPTTIQWVTCTPVQPVRLMKANTVYTLVLYDDEPAAKYYTLGVNEACGYAGGALRLVSMVGVEAARSPDADLLFEIGVANTPDTTLIAAGAIGYGQFITAVDIETPAGVDMSSYSDGDSLIKDLVEDLMLSGGPNGRRLLASVDVNRKARIFEEPVATATYRMDREGVLTTITGGQVIPYCPPIGAYVQMTDIIPAIADLGLITDPTLQFIEGATWNESSGLSIQFKGEDTIELLTKVAMDHPGA